MKKKATSECLILNQQKKKIALFYKIDGRVAMFAYPCRYDALNVSILKKDTREKKL